MAGRKRIYSEILDFENNDDDVVEDDDVKFKNPRKNLFDDFSKTGTTSTGEDQHMKVYLRIRPFTKDELEKNENQNCLSVDAGNSVTTVAPKDSHTYRNCAHGLGKTTHKYTFSKIFKDDTTQKDFFNETMLGLVKDFIDGQNCLVFTYGVTSSGKTYTIQGEPKDAGVLPRALDVLFNSINNKQWQNMTLKPKMFTDVVKLSVEQAEYEQRVKEKTLKLSHDEDPDVMSLLGEDASDLSQITNTTTSSESSNISCLDRPSKDSMEADEIFSVLASRIREETAVNVEDQGQIKFSIWVSFAEIYNEQIFDLLEPLPKKKNARRPVLKLSDDKNGSPYIRGLKEINVTNADEAYKLLTIGQRNLQKACTKLNHCSSRSHCIFNIKILRVVDKGDPRVARVSMLSLCDLAGSERHSKTHSAGDRLKEAGNINTSLMTLGRCIETLRYNQNHKDNQRIIPFRDSKLTRLFQNFFSGQGKAVMIVNVNQLASMFDETLHVFKFSAIAKQVTVVQKPDPPRQKLLSMSALKPPKDPRSSIMWDTPGAVKRMNNDLNTAQSIPLPEGDDDDLECDRSEEVEELVKIIQTLQAQLVEERRDKLVQECKIRDEVCKEMMKQLVEIENECSDRIRERGIMAEELADQRIKILMEGLEANPPKRPRQDFMEDDDDEWVSSILYHQEKVKVQEKENENKQLREEIDKLKSELKESKLEEFEEIKSKISSEQEKMKAENSNLQQLLSESQKNLVSLKKDHTEAQDNIKELQSQIKQLHHADKGDSNMELLENMTQKLQDAKEELKAKEEEVKELNDMLTEAGETFNQREVEMEELKSTIECDNEKFKQQEITIRDLEKALEESRKAVEAADERLKAKDERLLSLDSEADKIKEEMTRLQSNVTYLEDIVKEKENDLITWKKRCQREEEESFKKEQALIHGYKAEIGTLKQQIITLKASNIHAEKDKNISMATVEDLGHQLEMEKKSHSEDLSKVSELESKNITIEKLKQSLEEIKANYEDVESSLATKVEENLKSDVKIKELEEQLLVYQNKNFEKTVSDLEESLATSKTELQCKETEIDNLKEKVEELETVNKSLREMVNETTSKLQSKDGQVHELMSKVKVVEEHQTKADSSDSVTSLQKMMKDLKAENVSLKKQLEEKESELEKLRKKCDKMKTDRGKAKSVFTEKNDKMKELSASCKDLEFQLDEKGIEISDLRSEIQKLEEQLADRNSELGKKNKQLDELNDEMNKVKFAKEMVEADIQNFEIDGEKMKTLVAEKEELMDDLKKKAEHLVKLEAEIQAKDDNNSKLKIECENKDAEIEGLKKEVKKISKELEVKVDKKKADDNMDSLKKDLQNKSNIIATLEEKLREREGIQNELDEKSFEIVYLQSELSEKSNLKKGLEKMYEKISELEKELCDKEVLQRDLEEKKVRITEIETKLGNKEDAGKELEEKNSEITNLQAKLKQQKLDIAEANGRLEKVMSENEKLCVRVKENDTKADVFYSEIQELQSEVEGKKKEIDDLRSSCEGHKQRLCDKESEIETLSEQKDRLRKEVKEYSEKSGELEIEVMSKEKRLKELRLSYEEMQHQLVHKDDHISELSEAKLQIAELKSTVHMTKTLHQKAKDDASVKAKQVESLEEELRNLRCLSGEKQGLLDKLSERDHFVEELQSKLQTSQAEREEKHSVILRLEEEIGCLKSDLDENRKFESLISEKDSELKILHGKVDCLTKVNDGLKADISRKDQEIESLAKLIEDLKVTRGSEEEHVTGLMAEKNEEIRVLEDKISTLKSRLEGTEQKLEKEENSKHLRETELHNKVKELEDQLKEKVLETEKIRMESVNKETVKDIETKDVESSGESKNNKNCNVCEMWEKQASNLQKMYENERQKIEGYREMLEDMKMEECLSPSGKSSCVRKLRKEKIEADNSLIEARFNIQTLEKKVAELKSKTDSKQNVEVETCHSEKFSKMDKLIRKMTSELREKDDNNRKLVSELAQCHNKIEELENDIKENQFRRKEQEMIHASPRKITQCEQLQRGSITSPTVHRELNKSQEREQNLRTQLKEASKNMKEMNDKITDLEAKLQQKNLQIEELEDSLPSGSQKTPKKEDRFDDSEKLREELREKWKTIQDIQEEKSKLEQRLQAKLQTIKSLRDNMETERKGFDTALADAQANEKLIQSLKEGIAAQEETMEAQDLHIKSKEEEIELLNKEMEALADKNKRLLESSGDSGREMRDLTKENTHLKTENEMIARQLKEQKEEVDNNSKERNKLNNIIYENNKELKEMEKHLYECRAELEHGKAEKTKIETELKNFHNREKNFDEMRKELTKQLERMVPMEKENKSLKREIEQLKEEIDSRNDSVFKEASDVQTRRRNNSGKETTIRNASVFKEVPDGQNKRRNNSGQESATRNDSVFKELPDVQTKRRNNSGQDKKTSVFVDNPVIKQEIETPKSKSKSDSTYDESEFGVNEHREHPVRRPSSRRGRKRRSSAHDALVSKRQSKESDSTFVFEEGDISQHIQVDATPPVAAKAVRRSRKKRSSVDLLRDEKENGRKDARRTTRGGGKGVSRITSFVSAIKNSPITRTAKKLLEDISEASPNREQRDLPCSPSVYVEVADTSTQMSAEKTKEETAPKNKRSRKKHQLYKEDLQISEPLDSGNFVPSPDEVHQIVQRRLRSRRN